MCVGAPIFYVDLTVRTGSTLGEAITTARSDWDIRDVAGFNQKALDEACRSGLAHGAFEESIEEGPSIAEEFFPEQVASGSPADRSRGRQREALAERLSRKLEAPVAEGGGEDRSGLLPIAR